MKKKNQKTIRVWKVKISGLLEKIHHFDDLDVAMDFIRGYFSEEMTRARRDWVTLESAEMTSEEYIDAIENEDEPVIEMIRPRMGIMR